MRADIKKPESLADATNGDLTRRLRVVIADASPSFMPAVLSVMELHEVVDLIGRAATFEEVVRLVLNQQPDLVLIDLEMPLANLAIPTIILASRGLVKIIGLCAAESASFRQPEPLMTVDALVHKERLREELLNVLHAYLRTSAAFFSISSSPETEQAMHRWQSGLPLRTSH